MAKTLYGEYVYTGAVQTVTLPAGLYLFELYGAQGNQGNVAQLGGQGACVYSVIEFLVSTNINLYIGGGGIKTRNAGWNGGGTGGSLTVYGGGGGGATDIRIGGTALENRVLVAGGGGGSGSGNVGGYGGALSGGNGSGNCTGGTQTAGGSPNGTLGQGGDGTVSRAGAGGGGYYGGGGSQVGYGSGSGGSSYITTASIFSCSISNIRSGAGYAKFYALDSIEDASPVIIPVSYDLTYALCNGNCHFELFGSQGGFPPSYGDNFLAGKGGKVSGILSLNELTPVYITIGGRNGYGGGGDCYGGLLASYGGGATDIRIGGTALIDRVLVAGGGGGQAGGFGGAGGGFVGGSSNLNITGGTQTEGGSPNGALGQGGYGERAGGGGGYYGGGGSDTIDYGGAGGSSYYGGTSNYPVTNGSTETGVNEGNGYAVITLIPSTPPSNSAAVNIQGNNNPIGLNLFTPTDTLEHSLRIGTTNGIKAFKLVDVLDVNASPLRINTLLGIKAISKS